MGKDLTMVVKLFFCEHKLPTFMTHINLVLLPKKEFPRTFSYLR